MLVSILHLLSQLQFMTPSSYPRFPGGFLTLTRCPILKTFAEEAAKGCDVVIGAGLDKSALPSLSLEFFSSLFNVGNLNRRPPLIVRTLKSIFTNHALVHCV